MITVNKNNVNQFSKKYEVKTFYSGWGWFLFTVIGMSAKPSKVEFLDRETGKIVETSFDPEILNNFVGR
ncbi:MAG: hypothetical protein CVV23_08755 [Ignavibacteriae bacterium HGW-Ignavibacteriae-2]|jgi:hypothetical protein|nr:hypothetical protein [Bacteroidota bacterium]PKL88709.1 MAG: hypothetical protein CVV23_08755 [Ignavibacteriae bacterium HGW-Ignavibacteriae-2]